MRFHSENVNLQKQIDLLSSNDVKPDTESNLQNAISQKNQAFLELRDSFDDVITQKDNVIGLLKNKVNTLREQNINISNENQHKSASNSSNEEKVNAAIITKQMHDLEKQRDWLRAELDRVINEKSNVDDDKRNEFEFISSGLRGDVELALKGRKDLETVLEIDRLELENKLNLQQNKCQDLVATLQGKENLLDEKNSVIQNLQLRVEKAAEILSKEKYYENIEQRLLESDKSVNNLNQEKQSIAEEFNKLKLDHDSVKLELDLISGEKNQMKLELDGKIDEVLLNKAEYCQNLRTSFEETIIEKENILTKLRERVKNQEHEIETAVDAERNLLQSQFADVKKSYSDKVEQLELQLETILLEKETNVKKCAVSAEKDKTEQLETLQKDLNDLLNAKDEKIKDIYVQFSDSQQQCLKLEETVENLRDNVCTLDGTVQSLEGEVKTLKESNNKLNRDKASETEQIIISKGKQLKDLRNEFENVFNEKNEIVEGLRTKLKGLRNELVEAQEKLRDSLENNRNFEQVNTEIETGKIELDAKVSLLTDNLKQTKSDLAKEKELNKEQTTYTEQLMQENSMLMSGNSDVEKITSEMNDLSSNCKALSEENTVLKSQLKLVRDDSDDVHGHVIQLKEKISDKDKQIEQLEHRTQELKTAIFDHENTIKNIDLLVDNIPDLNNDSNTYEKIQQLLDLVTSSQKYNDELSKKLYEITEKEASLDVSVQCEIEDAQRSLEKHIDFLQHELLNLAAEKENCEDAVREKYDDILSSLRGDIDQAREGNTLLQEENFSLKSQLDVYTNVDGKRLQTTPKVSPPSPVVLPSSPASRPHFVLDLPVSQSNILPDTLQQSKQIPDSFLEQSFDTSPIKGDGRLEFIEQSQEYNLNRETSSLSNSESLTSEIPDIKEIQESKKTISKLKKMCRKYKDNALKSVEDCKSLELVVEDLKSQLQSASDLGIEDKHRCEKEIQVLREEINLLVGDKSTLVGSFKNRNETEMLNQQNRMESLKNMYENRLQETAEEIQQLTDENQKNELRVESQTSEIRRLEGELIKSRENITQSQSELDSVKNKLIQMEEVLDSKEEEATSYKIELSEANVNLEASLKEITKLQEQLKPKQVFSIETENPCFDDVEIQKYRNVLLDHQAKLEKANKTNEELQEDTYVAAETFGNEKSDFNNRISELEEQLKNTNKEKMRSEANVSSLREELSNVMAEREHIIAQWRAKLDDTVKEKENLQIEIDELNDELAQAQDEVSILNESIQDYQEKLTDTIDSVGRETSISQGLIANLNETAHQRDTVLNELEQSKLEMMILRSHVETSEQNYQTLLKNTEVKSKEIEDLNMCKNELQSKLANEKAIVQSLNIDCTELKSEKQELEGRLRRAMEQAWEEMVAQNNNLRGESFTKEKIIQELRRELGTLVREKEFLTSAMRGQLSSGGHGVGDTEYLQFQVQQLQREKDESSNVFDKLAEELKSKIDATMKEKSGVTLRMATLRAMLEQEVKDHEKTKFYKEQLAQTRGKALGTLKGSVSGMKDNLKSLRQDMDVNLSGMKDACQHFIMNLAPAMLNAQKQQQKQSGDIVVQEIGRLKGELKLKTNEANQAAREVIEIEKDKDLAESRLQELAVVLHQLGVVETVKV